ncbi:MAG: BrnT family toxin [Desulfobacterales bacterium]|nr:BrnT family toxin [Desulfobacterales bacterium]
MELISFSWDDRKSRTNQKKHGVPFREAETVFFDEKAIEYFDPDHSGKEDRYLMLGLSYRLRVLVISYCLRKGGSQIRLISARKATKKEKKAYFGGEG